jgi:hypothetical protein
VSREKIENQLKDISKTKSLGTIAAGGANMTAHGLISAAEEARIVASALGTTGILT